MNAKKAKQLSVKNTKTLIVYVYGKNIDARIKSAAQSGKNNVIHPFLGLNLSYDKKKALKLYYMNKGFNVIDHPDPDPGHPASRPFTEIKW